MEFTYTFGNEPEDKDYTIEYEVDYDEIMSFFESLSNEDLYKMSEDVSKILSEKDKKEIASIWPEFVLKEEPNIEINFKGLINEDRRWFCTEVLMDLEDVYKEDLYKFLEDDMKQEVIKRIDDGQFNSQDPYKEVGMSPKDFF